MSIINNEDTIVSLITRANKALYKSKEQGKNIIAKLDGVNYRDEAEALIGTEIAIHKDQLEVLAEDEYFRY